MTGRQIPVSFDDVPDGQLLPRGMYMMEVESIEEAFSREAGYLMYKTAFTVVEPAQYAGVTQYDYYVIGNSEDPKAEKSETWLNSIGMKRLKRLLRATLVPYTSDIDELINRLTGQKFLAAIKQEIDTKSKDPKYQGMKRNRIEEMHTLGSAAVGISGGSDVEVPTLVASTAQAVPAAVPSAPAAPKPTRATTSATLSCPYCGIAVSRSDYTAHRKASHPEEE